MYWTCKCTHHTSSYQIEPNEYNYTGSARTKSLTMSGTKQMPWEIFSVPQSALGFWDKGQVTHHWRYVYIHLQSQEHSYNILSRGLANPGFPTSCNGLQKSDQKSGRTMSLGKQWLSDFSPKNHQKTVLVDFAQKFDWSQRVLIRNIIRVDLSRWKTLNKSRFCRSIDSDEHWCPDRYRRTSLPGFPYAQINVNDT